MSIRAEKCQINHKEAILVMLDQDKSRYIYKRKHLLGMQSKVNKKNKIQFINTITWLVLSYRILQPNDLII